MKVSKISGYFRDHWRGKHSLIRSFFINGLLVYVLAVGVVAGIGALFPSNQRVTTLALLVFLVVLAWSLEGNIRAAIKALRNKKLRLLKKIGAVGVILIALIVLGDTLNDMYNLKLMQYIYNVWIA